MNGEYKRHFTFLLLVAGIVLATGLGLRDPWPADEPRFALIAREMVESGSWLIPHIGGVPYPDKPPLFFWLVAALYTLTGSLKVSLLLPGVIAGLSVVALVTDLGRRLWNPSTGIWCGATLLATVQFVLQMKMGQIDGLLCLWTTLGIYGFSRHLLLGPDWRWYGIAGLSAGLGVITKGVGFLPYLIFLPYLFALRTEWPVFRHTWRDERWLIAPLATLVIICAWLIPMLLATGHDADLMSYRNNILFHQTVTRYVEAWGHIKPVWYLFTNAIPGLWLPLSVLLPWLVPAWWRDIRNRDAKVLLLGGWMLLVLLFFSLSAGKRSLYIFPAVPALALIAGCHAARLVRFAGVQRVLVAMPVIIGLGLFGVAIFSLMNPHEVEQWLINVPTIIKTSLSVLGIGILMLGIVIVSRRRRFLTGYAVAMAVLWMGAGLLVAPALNGIRSGTVLIESVEEQLGPSVELGFVAWPEQFLLHWHRQARHFGYRRDPRAELKDAVSWVAESADRRLLLPDTIADSCLEPALVTPVGRAHRRNWLLADETAVRAACRHSTEPLAISYSREGRRERLADSGS